ncbi:hypothetical protein NPIL_513201 [Nephila pilipes]|uniref:Uncharacterized protein n=1 Tax=Nephila pilipes TaxID=299642 RepID=A0A8X6TFG3_NEPPI|nr:hypothetical protein NPIL_513201 [Nephila pilipes]
MRCPIFEDDSERGYGEENGLHPLFFTVLECCCTHRQPRQQAICKTFAFLQEVYLYALRNKDRKNGTKQNCPLSSKNMHISFVTQT